MVKLFKAPFAQSQRQYLALAVTAVGSLATDTPANTVLLGTIGDDGALLTHLSARPRATVGATALYLFLSLDNGATKQLIKSVLMAAHTVAADTAVPDTDFGWTRADAKALAELTGGNAAELYIGIGVTGDIVFAGDATDY